MELFPVMSLKKSGINRGLIIFAELIGDRS